MATTVWGSGLSGDEVLALAGHVELTGTEIVSAALQDAPNQFSADANTLGLWHCDEAAWGGVAGEVLDASGNAYHGVRAGSANTVTGGLRRTGRFSYSSSDCVSLGTPSGLYLYNGPSTHEMWISVAGMPTALVELMNATRNNPWPGREMQFFANGQLSYFTGLSGDWNALLTSAGVVTADGLWHHVAFQGTGSVETIWYDGTLRAQRNRTPASAGGSARNISFGGWVESSGNNLNGRMDEVRVSNVARYSATFYPTMYLSGSSVLTKTAEGAARKVSAVDWAGTFGASYGSLYRVQVNTGSDVSPTWTTVGGDNPTSPITGLDLTVQSGVTRWARVYLEPKADTTKSATPILSALRLTHEPNASGAFYYGSLIGNRQGRY